LYSFSPSGSLNWAYVTDGIVYSTPSISPLGDVIVYGYQTNYVYCITSGGSLKWRHLLTTSGASNGGSPVVDANGIIYVPSDSLYSLYPSGSLRWVALANVNPNTPIISSSGILFAGAGSTIYTVGTTLSTLAPVSISQGGGLLVSPSPKFKGNSMNTVRVHLSTVFMIV
jgi:hypothetical protein